MLRFPNMAALRKAISPDIEIVDDDPPTETKKQLVKANRSQLEDRFYANWLYLGGPELIREYRFHPTRKWRFDFAHPATMVAIEIMGGLYQAQSGHRSSAGVKRDYEKSNAGQTLGWKIHALTSADIQNPTILEALIQEIWNRRNPVIKGDHNG